MSKDNDVVITGIGLLSSLGEGVDAHWSALTDYDGPTIDTDRFAPYAVHPLTEVDWSLQIAKRGDLRQMEPWQRIGTYTAGLALEDAGIKGDDALCSSMDLVVAAGGGERDIDVDTMILTRTSKDAPDRDVAINQVLTTELRPTLFLAQLSNLLAGNISIVHKVTGSSRTFMGEDGAGISAIQTAAARIRAGQSSHALVGSSYNCEHPDMLLGYELGQHLHRGAWKPVWQRGGSQGGGVVPGSGGVFLVLESRAHAAGRGARIYATLGPVAGELGPTDGDNTVARLDALAARTGMANAGMIVSSASGGHSRTAQEMHYLSSAFPGTPVRGISTSFGHLRDAQFPAAIAIAALALGKGAPVPVLDPSFETESAAAPDTIGVITVGFSRSEGMALLGKAQGMDA